MSHSSMDCYASSDSTRVPSSSPSSTSSTYDPAVINTISFGLFSNDNIQQVSWPFDNNSGANGTYTGALFDSPHGATQQAVEAAVLHSSSPPTVQLHNLSLSSSPSRSPCGAVTYVQGLPIVAPRPVSSSPPLIGRGWTYQPPPVFPNDLPSEPPAQAHPVIPRPQTLVRIPPEKGRKSFPCLHAGCGMKFPKRNALVQHMRSHTGERPEVCDWCSRAFSLKCNLRRHWRTCKTKKAMEAAPAVKKDTSYSPPPFDPSPSPASSSPSPPAAAPAPTPAAVATTSHNSAAPAEFFATPPNLWDSGFSVPPNYHVPTMDMNCANLFPTHSPFATYPYPPTLVQAHL